MYEQRCLQRTRNTFSTIVIRLSSAFKWGFPGGASDKESACNAGDVGSIPGLGRSLGWEWQPTPVFLPGKLHGQRSLASYSPWDCKESTDWATYTSQLSNQFYDTLQIITLGHTGQDSVLEWLEICRSL